MTNLIMKKFYLNKNLINIIYQYDPTYHIYFKLNVLPYLKKIWSVKWTCIKTKTTGIDLSGFSGLNTNIGIKAVSLKSGKTIYELNSKSLFNPASNNKLYSAIEAL